MNQDTFCSSHLNLIIPYSTFLNLDISCTIYLILDIFYSYCGNLDIPFFLPKPGYIFPFLTWTWIYAAQCSFFTLTWICCSSYLNLDIFFSFYTQTWIYCYSCLNLDTICSLYLTLDIIFIKSQLILKIFCSSSWTWIYPALTIWTRIHPCSYYFNLGIFCSFIWTWICTALENLDIHMLLFLPGSTIYMYSTRYPGNHFWIYPREISYNL